mmetsp:Transcript_26389/g.29630  ORF Transcript_26389/g.29630 Transcript_26389/m.29630 type:complete len:98 (+) Transcript_26389:21-314(+)
MRTKKQSGGLLTHNYELYSIIGSVNAVIAIAITHPNNNQRSKLERLICAVICDCVVRDIFHQSTVVVTEIESSVISSIIISHNQVSSFIAPTPLSQQ